MTTKQAKNLLPARAFRLWRRVAGVAVLTTVGVGGVLLGQTKPPTPAPAAPSAVPARPAAPVAVAPVTTAGLDARFKGQIQPFLVKHCNACHAGGKHKGDLSLDPYTTLLSVQNGREKWSHIAEVTKQKLMPPEEKPQPTAAELEMFHAWVSDALNYCDCTGARDSGRVAIHRLNKTEYNNTVRDLLGVDFKPAKDFPADDTGYGFDNIADVLTMSPLLAEKYIAAAEQVMDKVVPSENPNRARVRRYAGDTLKANGDGANGNSLTGRGDLSTAHEFAADGQYEVRVRGSQRKVGDENAKLVVKVDGRDVGTVEVTGTREKPAVAKVKFDAKAGSHKVAVALLNPANVVDPATKKQRFRGATLEWVEIDGPFNAAAPPPSPAYRKVFIATPTATVTEDVAARTILQRFLARAFRRPTAADEVESLFKVFKSAKADGETFEQAIRLSCTAVLVSPHFLFRVEVDPPAVTPAVGAATNPANPVPYLVGDYELASRLSYFLWSSMPDEELLAAAGGKRLRDPVTLEAQVKRMLADPRSAALVENFAGQWLELRNLDDYKPDPKFYPTFDADLKAAVKRETELFFRTIVAEDRSVMDLLNGDYTFVNERLAKHYGIPNVTGNEFRKVSLAGTKRGGILTQASVLTVTAMPTRTSPVKRGKFVLENVLGVPPPPPPANVPSLSEEAGDISKATLKVRLEAHRKDPNCAVCHIKMDAIGFSLENFDAIGQWRDRDGKFPVDATGILPDGTTLNGADGLRKMLGTQQKEFLTTMIRKLLTYGLGRGLEHNDQCTVKDIEGAARLNGYKFSTVVMGVVKSDAFQKRRLLRPDEVRLREDKAQDEREKK